MNKMLVFLLLLFPLFAPSSADAQVAKETPLMTKDLPDVPGKEGLIETVVLSPGEVVPARRHNADVFAYVLKGSVVTQSKGGKSQKVHAGEVFYESPTSRFFPLPWSAAHGNVYRFPVQLDLKTVSTQKP